MFWNEPKWFRQQRGVERIAEYGELKPPAPVGGAAFVLETHEQASMTRAMGETNVSSSSRKNPMVAC
jgi:hypothetical protein